MKLISHFSKPSIKYIDSELKKKILVEDIIQVQEDSIKFTEKFNLPSKINVFYKISEELKRDSEKIAYYYGTHEIKKRKIVLFIDALYEYTRQINKEEYLKQYVGSILVHELCHAHEWTNKLPITYDEYNYPLKGKENLIYNCYDFIREFYAEEQSFFYLKQNGISYKKENLFLFYGHILEKFNSPKYMYKKIIRLINVSRLYFNENWFDYISLNPPSFDDLNSPEDYVEYILYP